MNNRGLRVYTCAAAAVLMAIPAAAQNQQNAANRSVMPDTAGQSRITREVRHELVMLPYYGVFDNLVYQVNGSTVTLLGQVTLPTLKNDAERAVKNIEGVQKVVNQIQVLPTSTMDDRLRLAEYRAIYGQSPLDRYALQAIPPIHIIVDNGHVTLDGVVASQSDKDMAAVRANAVSGVFSVTNNLKVEPR